MNSEWVLLLPHVLITIFSLALPESLRTVFPVIARPLHCSSVYINTGLWSEWSCLSCYLKSTFAIRTDESGSYRQQFPFTVLAFSHFSATLLQLGEESKTVKSSGRATHHRSNCSSIPCHYHQCPFFFLQVEKEVKQLPAVGDTIPLCAAQVKWWSCKWMIQ